jgi:hypothetical protein
MPKTVRTLTDAEAAYIAGIVDGEGTVSLVRHHSGERRRPVVSVANTEYELLAYLKQTIGAGRITRKCVAKDHHTPSFAFAIYSRQALELLRQISSYLRTHKRARAELLLAQYLLVTPRNGRYTGELIAARAAFETQFFGICVRQSGSAVAAGTVGGTRSLSGNEHARSSAGGSGEACSGRAGAWR